MLPRCSVNLKKKNGGKKNPEKSREKKETGGLLEA
jgi:hypothetical protein